MKKELVYNNTMTIENLFLIIMNILNVKGSYELKIGDFPTSFNPDNNIFFINDKILSDTVATVRLLVHECYHAYQIKNGVSLVYKVEDRERIERGESYIEYNYDFEVEADAFSYLFVNRIGANISVIDDIKTMSGMSRLNDDEINFYIERFNDIYEEIRCKYEPIIDSYL